MGVRGEIFSNKVMLPNRTYFFNVKENRLGDLYLNIVESKNRDEGGFDRQSVILFADDLQEFLKGFDESLKVMEKAVREKRQTGSVKAVKGTGAASTDRPSGGKTRSDGKFEKRERPSRSFNQGERNSERRNDRGGDRETHYKNRGGERRNERGGVRSGERETSFKKRGDFSRSDSGFKKREGEFKKRGTDRTRQNTGGRNRGREQSDDRGFEPKRGKRVVVKKKY